MQNKIILLLVLSAFFCHSFSQEGKSKEEKKVNIGVMGLKAEGAITSASNILSDRLRAELFNTGKFQVMERGEMDAVLKEQGFQQSGACDDKACMVEVGQLLGVEKMVAGSLGQLGSLYLINLRIIDVKTGQLMDTYSGECRCAMEELGGAMKTAAIALAFGKNAPPQPAPAAVSAPVAATPTPAAAQPAPAPAPSEAAAQEQLKWGIAASFSVGGADPEVNHTFDFYKTPPFFHIYQFSEQNNGARLTSFKTPSFRISRALRRNLALSFAYGRESASGNGSYLILKSPSNPNPPTGGSPIGINTSVVNNYFKFGAIVSWFFGRLQPFLGLDLNFANSVYTLDAGGHFTGPDTASVSRDGPVDAHLTLKHDGPGLDATAGAVFMLGRRLGVSLSAVFNRMVFSQYEGGGDVSSLESVLSGNPRSQGNGDYFLATAKNQVGGDVFLFSRKNNGLGQTALNNVKGTSASFSGVAAELGLRFYF